ncbi:MAG: nucleoside triphosphate pyrophosphohydrolase [Synechococcales bacterium]|nr:nucleoside triphosphate pyrophosphohydrolase [Synechococcales bacterium]
MILPAQTNPSDMPACGADVLTALQQLITVVAQLRHPEGGCPWDLAQTQASLQPYIIEEAYEVVDAIASQNQEAIAEELGDLLLQVVLQAQVAHDHGYFDLTLVAQKITEKLIRRHPHVFGSGTAQTPEQVHQQWEQIKAAELAAQGISPQVASQLSFKLNKVLRSQPPLTATMQISQKAAQVGFEWDTIKAVWQKVEEEWQEFHQALAEESADRQEEEFGDLLFSLLQIARWKNLDPNSALTGTNRRFIQRLQVMEQYADRPLQDYSLAELETLWQQAKQQLRQGDRPPN